MATGRMESVYPNTAATVGGRNTGEETSVMQTAMADATGAAPPAPPARGRSLLNSPAVAITVLVAVAVLFLLDLA